MYIEYKNIFTFLLINLLLSIIIYSASFLLIKRKSDVEKLTAYECGFNPYEDARKIFDVRFYLIAMLFIIFDLETVFIIPWVSTLEYNHSFSFWLMVEFLTELIVGYIYIWYIGAFEWN